ncbi:MAG: acetylxylan esterase [Armatimonadetes bacterium]|nr:acetylxylan esterase [Armatimonadota bacterium]
MPLVDMPLDDLLQYKGRNPRPSDFDFFWNDSLKELADTAPLLEITKKDFPSSFAECFELRFKGTRGGSVFAKYVRPKGKKECPVLLRFHGYSGNSGDWQGHLSWAAQGFAVASMDCRGQGGYSEDTGVYSGMTLRGHIVRGLDGPPEQMYFRNVFLDTAQLARVVADFDEVNPTRIGATGGSQGGGLTLACAALAPVKKCAPVFPFLCDYKRVWEMDLAKDAYDELRYFFRSFDPRHEREEEIFTKLGYIDNQHLATRIKGEVLLVGGLMDTITPPSTYFAAYNRITAKKRHVIYPDFGHEGLPGSDDLIWEFFADL